MQPARPSLPRFPAAESPASARRGGVAAVALGLSTLVGSGCFLGDTTVPPPVDAFYYPTGLVRSPGGSTLYVANSDFDLQYEGGTVFALDLTTLRPQLGTLLAALRAVGTDAMRTVDAACDGICTTPSSPSQSCRNTNSVLHPGPCLAIPLSKATGDNLPAVSIGAFASGAVLVKRPNNTTDARLFIPVRGDPSITFIDVSNDEDSQSPGAFTGKLQCTSSVSVKGARCTNDHLIGIAPFESTRSITLPTEPVGVAVSEDGSAIVVAHQTQQSVSLSVNRWPASVDTMNENGSKPTLEFVLGNLPTGPTEVVTVPIPKLFKARVELPIPTIDYQPGFLVTYRAAPVVDLLRVHKNESGTARPFLSRSNETLISVNADGKDSRGIAIDSSARQSCEEDCPTDLVDGPVCLLGCMKIPIAVYIANRTPPSLLVGRIETTTTPEDSTTPTGAFDRVLISDSIPLAQGASKIAVGDVIDPEGKPSRRVFTAAFDSRLVFSYDPQARRVDAIIKTGRGPHALAFDHDDAETSTIEPGNKMQKGHAFLYIGHFTDSYLGVVDLDMRHPETFGTIFASVGTPMPPRGSK
jgi:DNA-binding beta-propeller fold protein YncE